MYKRLVILFVIIFSALAGLSWLGYNSIKIRELRLVNQRIGEFESVAGLIKTDIMKKLDDFLDAEQKRPYSDYQYFYVPDNVVGNVNYDQYQQGQALAQNMRQVPVMRSPLAGQIDNGLAYGYFQVEQGGNIVTANDNVVQLEGDNTYNNSISVLNSANKKNIEQNLLPLLDMEIPVPPKSNVAKNSKSAASSRDYNEILSKDRALAREGGQPAKAQARSRRSAYQVKSIDRQGKKEPSVYQQSRAQIETNRAANYNGNEIFYDELTNSQSILPQQILPSVGSLQQAAQQQIKLPEQKEIQSQQQMVRSNALISNAMRQSQSGNDTVRIRVEPFVPVVVPGGDDEQRQAFDGQVFLLRHIQIEDDHFVQGFKLNETKLLEEVEESASRLMLEGMTYEISPKDISNSAYTAILDFGFGQIFLNLFERDAGWITKDISKMKNWYFVIITFVFLAVTLGLVSLWRNASAQLKLAQKKDDFISAVSHELRTPLTSIRMYSEMLEKNWVKSPDKLSKYYTSMRQESERLTRLIENVLDFSRIQRNRKKFNFSAGDINTCVETVVEMMRPYAAQHGFVINIEPGDIEQATFDSDAVTQIVVNLLDNAVKYARKADDKTIIVRTSAGGGYVNIEVEDHGPGIPHRQRKKVFEQFYRCAAESTRETTGTGLGLAIVQKFAQAHDGFVEILNAKPSGAIFKVALAIE